MVPRVAPAAVPFSDARSIPPQKDTFLQESIRVICHSVFWGVAANEAVTKNDIARRAIVEVIAADWKRETGFIV
jgi:hypothetical protein